MRQATVAIIDNDDYMRRSIETLLSDAGYSVASFGSAEAFLKSSGAAGVGCVILELIMPGMCGLDAIPLLKDRFLEMKVVAISRCGRAKNLDLLDAAVRLGADARITKPFERSQLLETLDALLRTNPALKTHRTPGSH